MSARELKRIQATHGFAVASHNTRTGRRSVVYQQIDTTPPPPPPQTPKPVKKKKRPNPYSGPSGQFSRKAKWSKAKKPRKLDLEDVNDSESAYVSPSLFDPLVGC